MIKKVFLLLAVVLFISACTKEVPENEKRISKSFEENEIRTLIDMYYKSYNDNDIETAVSFFHPEYKGVAADSEDVVGIQALESELYHFRKQYPDGQWDFKIEELYVQNELGYVITSGSFMMPDPIENKMSPRYSERSIRVLRKVKNLGWKIYRSFSVPTFSYD